MAAVDELTQLREELEETRSKLYEAAECGNTLLSTNQLLNDKLESREKEYADELEGLEQENYSLRRKVEVQEVSVNSIQRDLEAAHLQLEEECKQHAASEKRLKEVHAKNVSELKASNDDLKIEIGKLNVQIKTYQERVKKLDEILEQLREESSSRSDATILHNDLMDLENLYSTEKTRCETLELELLESGGQLEEALLSVRTLQERLEGLEEECQERNQMAKEWYDALQSSKDHNAELSSQIELLKSQLRGDADHSTTGNSLFGEVDDRRMNVERKMITLKVKYESLERTHATATQQLRKLKAEMSALLCQYSSTAADASQVLRLQRALGQSKSELQVVTAKLHHLEQQHAEGVAVQDVKKYMSAFVDFGEKYEYVKFLEQELDQEKKAHSAVMKELDLKRTQLLWETNKLCEAEAKLHQSQQKQAKLRKEQTVLSMRNHELLEQLQQVDVKCKQHEAEKNYLEEELKARGKGKNTTTTLPVQPPLSQAPQHPCTTSQPFNSLKSTPLSTQSDHIGAPHSNDENVVPPHTDVAAEKPNSQPQNFQAHTHADIDILEDLDRRLNMNLGITDGKSNLGSQEERFKAVSSSDHRTDNYRKVVHVSSKDTVNKCPQQ